MAISIKNDGFVNSESGQVADTAYPWTLRVALQGFEGGFLIGFFDTAAHAATAVSNAEGAGQLTSTNPGALTTWMGTTSPQTGFLVAPRNNLSGQPLLDSEVT